MKVRQSAVALTTLAMAIAVCVGCAPDQGDARAADAPKAGGQGGGLYVDRLVEGLNADGNNEQQRNYREMLRMCQEAGVATQPLSEADAAKVGTRRLQLWQTADAFAYRDEAWDFAAEDKVGDGGAMRCRFYLHSSGEHAYYDERRSMGLDLATNQRDNGETDPSLVHREAIDAPDAQALQQSRDSLQAQGPAADKVAGQPCDRWQSARESFCVWNSGLARGYATDPRPYSRVDGFPVDSIVLAQQPLPGTDGDRVTTQTFVIGGIDRGAMQPAPATARPKDLTP